METEQELQPASVLDLSVGQNLDELRLAQPMERFPFRTTMRLGLMILKEIIPMHTAGLVHRDLKPSNFKFDNLDRSVVLMKFSSARQFDSTNCMWPPPFSGVHAGIRYASLNANRGRNVGRQDDLWSLFYILVEFVNGKLPWQNLQDKKEVANAKERCDNLTLIENLPFEMKDFLEHINSLTYCALSPDYNMLILLFESCIKRLGIKETDPYDWELSTAPNGKDPEDV